MIEQGQMTIIGSVTYRCIKIDGENAYLKNILHEQGRPLVMERKYCPYVLDGKLITPEKPKPEKYVASTKINISKIIKENTDLTVSNDAKYFLTQWAETALANMINHAEQNALERGDRRIRPAHIFWIETNDSPLGYWVANNDYMKDD